MIETSNFEGKSSFEKKCLNIGLQMFYNIVKQEKRKILNKIDVYLCKLHNISPENLYNNITINSPKPYPSSTTFTKLNSQ